MIIARTAKSTLTPVELDIDDSLLFTLHDGKTNAITVVSTSAEVLARDYASYGYHQHFGNISAYAFSAVLRINEETIRLERQVGTQQSFYNPCAVHGMRIWLDAVGDIFEQRGGFMGEKDWRGGLVCQPRRRVRLAVQDATLPICPEPIVPWFDVPGQAFNIHDCYNGEDCWMGPYGGGVAHCGLDINMPSGTELSAPITFDDHYLFNSLAAGANNNRWRGVRRWPDGAEWWLQAHHLNALLVPERTPLAAGTPYARAAGVHTGAHEHAHFVFRVIEQGGDYLLDPWIIFWQCFQQRTMHELGHANA